MTSRSCLDTGYWIPAFAGMKFVYAGMTTFCTVTPATSFVTPARHPGENPLLRHPGETPYFVTPGDFLRHPGEGRGPVK